MTTKLRSIADEAAACRKANAKTKVGDWLWHLHHETLAEQLTEPVEHRIAYILAHKPEAERALRLRLMRPVKSRVVAPAQQAHNAALASAQQAYDAAIASARQAYDAAVAPARQAYDAAVASAQQAYDAAVASAQQAYDAAVAPARQAYDDAVAPAEQVTDAATASAHAKECHGCPFDGTTIFRKAS